MGLKLGAGKKRQAKDPWWKRRIEKSEGRARGDECQHIFEEQDPGW